MSIAYENYGEYSNNNYGVNTLKFIDIQGNQYWFSYKTLVAFCINGEFHIHQNDWGVTTGKHLNWIDKNKSIRETEEQFQENLERLQNN